MRIRVALLLCILAAASARADVISYDSIHGIEITFEDARWLSRELETWYSAQGVHFFQAAAVPVAFGDEPRNITLINNQPRPCLIIGCPPYVQFLPPVSSPFALNSQWRPMWATFDAPITEFGFQELEPGDSYTTVLIDSIRAYRAGVLVGEESFALPPGASGTGVGARFSTPFDLVLLDRQARDPATGAGGFIDGPEFIDNVRFAPAILASIPEPSGAMLFGLGGLAWLSRRYLSGR